MKTLMACGSKHLTAGPLRGLLNLRRSIGLLCERSKKKESLGRSTKVSATFEGPKSEHDLAERLPPISGHRRESEPDEATARDQAALYDRMLRHESDGCSVRFLQRVPADRLGEYVFLREGEKEGDL